MDDNGEHVIGFAPFPPQASLQALVLTRDKAQGPTQPTAKVRYLGDRGHASSVLNNPGAG
jgi:hypothetical protein